jgi:hypothetical protein
MGLGLRWAVNARWGCGRMVAIALALAVCLAARARAQGTTDGAIGGHVVGAAGATVSGAFVLVRGVETGRRAGAVSGTRGEFLVVGLPPGEYGLTAEAAGVRLTVGRAVTVHEGGVTEVELRLAGTSGAAAARIGMDPGDATTVGSVERAGLPVDGGQWGSLALLLPGVDAAAGADDDAADVSARGVAVTQNGTSVDGTNADESFGAAPAGAGVSKDEGDADDSGAAGAEADAARGGRRAGASYTFAQAAVREFRVSGQADAAAYGSALYGHGVGGVITAAPRTGSATLHGMAFYTVRESAWAAADAFSVATSYANGVVTSGVVKPSDLRQQFGGRVGGAVPALRRSAPRLFYFYAFDQQRHSFPAVASPGYAGFYSLTATQTALLANRGVSSAKIVAALNYLSSLTGTVPRQADQTVNFGRLDWQGSGGSRAAVEYNRARWSNPAGARSAAVVDRGVASLGSSFGKVDQGTARWVWAATPRLSHEIRVEYGRELQYEQPQTPLPQEPAVEPGGLPPEVAIGPDGLTFGTPAGLGQRAYPEERHLGGADVLSWVRGRHWLRLGAEVAAVHDYTDSLTNAEGTFRYDSGATGGKAGGLVDWITDYTFNVSAYPNGACPSIVAAVHDFCFRSYSQSFGQQNLSFDTQEWAGFAQDDWRVARTLTLHLGLRYEYEYLPLPQTPNAGLDAVFGAVGATSVFPEDRNNLGPRLGVAWAPFGAGRGVVRAGYGGYFGRLPGATVRAALLGTAMAGSTTSVRFVPGAETLCPQVPNQGFGYACSYLAAPGGAVGATTSAVVFDRRFRLPEVQQGTLALEREVAWGVVARAGYTLNLDRQLPNSVDINIAPSGGLKQFQLVGGTGAAGVRDGEVFAVPAYTTRVSASFGPVTDVVSNANATYHGTTLEAWRAARRGLEFRVGWTWSKALDFGQNGGAVPRQNGQFDPIRVRYDKGLAALNFPHRVVASAVWTPAVEGRGWLRALAGGWSAAGIFSESSGRGYSYEIFGGTRLAGGHESINGSGGSVVLPTVGRNTLRLPDTANLDVRLGRGVRLGDRMRLRGLAEVFNLANRTNYSAVTQRAFLVGTTVAGVTPLVFQDTATVAAEGLNARPFGTYTAAGTSQAGERRVQLGLRLEF